MNLYIICDMIYDMMYYMIYYTCYDLYDIFCVMKFTIYFTV